MMKHNYYTFTRTKMMLVAFFFSIIITSSVYAQASKQADSMLYRYNFNIITKEILLAELDPNSLYFMNTIYFALGGSVSPDNQKIAYREYVGDKSFQIKVNGHLATQHVLNRVGILHFSPDSQHLYYTARRKVGGTFIVFDGEEHVTGLSSLSKILFSPNSKLAIFGKRDESNLVLINGSEYGFDGDIKDCSFSSDSKRLVYQTRIDGKYQVVLLHIGEKQEFIGDRYDSMTPPKFSSDGNHIQFVARRGVKRFLVIDGKEIQEIEKNSSFIWNSDYERFAYVGKREGKQFAVVDNKEEKEHDKVYGITFSPDGKHIAYVIRDDNIESIVLDGIIGKWYNRVGWPYFNPDSLRLFYIAIHDNRRFSVIDGLEGDTYSSMHIFSKPVFSPDSKNVAYVVECNGKNWIVLNETEGKKYNEIRGRREHNISHWDDYLAFSPDSKTLAYWAREGRSWKIVVNGVEIDKKYDGYIEDSKLKFASPNLLHAVAYRGSKIFRIEVNISENK